MVSARLVGVENAVRLRTPWLLGVENYMLWLRTPDAVLSEPAESGGEAKRGDSKISPYLAAPPPVFSLYKGFKFRMWHKYGLMGPVHNRRRRKGRKSSTRRPSPPKPSPFIGASPNLRASAGAVRARSPGSASTGISGT